MVSIGLTWLVASTVLFVLMMVAIQAEKKRGQRFLLASVRGWLDTKIAYTGRRIAELWDHFTRYIVQLGWYYGIHSFLRAVLATLVASYERVERAFESNRQRTKQLRAEKKQVTATSANHLTEMAQHKVDTALTPAQQRKLKRTQLEGD